MIGTEELRKIREAMQMVSEGKIVEKKNGPSWMPESVEDKDTFIQSIKEAYEAGKNMFSYGDVSYSVEFFKEDRTVSVKPGVFGKTNVLLGESVLKSFAESRQARVYATYIQEHVKTMAKTPFSVSLVKSVSVK